MDDPKPCLIVECSDAETWPNLFTAEPSRAGFTTGPLRIPQPRQPAILQPDHDHHRANAQATRRAKAGTLELF